MLALLFVTLPFVVRSVQPVLLELDRDMEEAAASLGAGRFTIFRRVILPNLLPAILSGAALAFARAMGEFGSVVLISGNIPFKTQVASVYIFGADRERRPDGRGRASPSCCSAISFASLLADRSTCSAAGRSRHDERSCARSRLRVALGYLALLLAAAGRAGLLPDVRARPRAGLGGVRRPTPSTPSG